MALIYNKIGDILFLYAITICYYILLSFDFELILLFIIYYYIYYPILLLFIIISFTTKSAQCVITFFFMTYLCNVSTNTSLVSSLLHSSTMVIAGLYIAILLCVSINISIYIYLFNLYYLLLYYYPLLIALFTIVSSSIISLFIIDIKSIIAYSTIGQIAYILLNLYISSSISLSHIFIHSFYKCLLFLLSAEIIHNIESN